MSTTKEADKNQIITKIIEEGKIGDFDLKETAPQVLIEILYEYLSQSVSTHFEKTLESIDTLHNVLKEMKKEHDEIVQKLDDIEVKVNSIIAGNKQ